MKKMWDPEMGFFRMGVTRARLDDDEKNPLEGKRSKIERGDN